MVVPPLSDIKFSNDYIDDSAELSVAVIPFETDIELASTSLMFDESKIIEIHIIVKALSEDEPVQVGQIQKEIERIITQNPMALKNEGISLMLILDYREIFDDDNTDTSWHFCYDVQLFYRKFVSVTES